MMQQNDILCLRHACSQFNVGENEFYAKNPDMDQEQAEGDKKFCEQVLFSTKYIDAYLSEEGIQQCELVRNDPTIKEAQIVLVSPLNRTLQTAEIVFGKLSIPFVVVPELTESFRYSCDLSRSISDKMLRFKSFDFSGVAKFQNHWEINNIHTSRNRQILRAWMDEHPHSTLDQQQAAICQMVGSRTLVQRNKELRDRCRKITQILRSYRQKYNKVAIVSHYWTLRYLLNQKFDSQSNGINLPDIKNARPYWVSLKRLLLHL